MKDQDSSSPNEFLAASREQGNGPLWEFFLFLAHNKKWWLGPIILVLLLFGLLILLGGSSAAPFLYPLF